MIRAIALLLVLVNLGFLAWQFWLVPEPELTPPLPESLPPLVLVTEAEVLVAQAGDDSAPALTTPDDQASARSDDAVESVTDAEPDDTTGPIEGDPIGATTEPGVTTGTSEEVAPAGSPPRTEPEMVCRSVGPFTSQVESRRAAAMLAETGRVPLQRVTEGEVWLGYWVYLAPFESAEAAEEVAQNLARSLVDDFYIIRTGDMANAISLGVYSQTDGAEERQNEMRDRGFPAELTDRYRSAPVYWLDFADFADTPLSLSLLMPASPGRVLRSESGDCALP
jgi:hypothetical protein